ncbi:MAG: hypothetical protein PHF54_03515, partial [Candidatus Pacebacteria bacterium]|nr:hypothetical protein [Candidatus Paceibacterota bacterium]
MNFFSDKWRVALLIIVLLLALFIVVQPELKSSNSAVEKAMSYINETLLGGANAASLSSVVDNDIESLHRVKIEVQGNIFDVFVSSDGKYLFIDGPIDMTASI